MKDSISIDTSKISDMKKEIAEFAKYLVNTHDKDCKALDACLNTIIKEYSDYSSVSSQARTIKTLIQDIQKGARTISTKHVKLTDGLTLMMQNYLSMEKETADMLKLNTTAQTKITSKVVGSSTILGRSALPREASITDGKVSSTVSSQESLKETIIIKNYSYTLEDMLKKQSGKNTTYKNGWVTAKDSEIKDYINPNKYCEGIYKYQFLDLSAPASISKSDMKNFLKEKGILAGKEDCYLEAAKKYGISEVYLAAHSVLETGNGKSKLATGVKMEDGTVVYNMYGIGAYDSDPIGKGAAFAKKMGWTTPEKAIEGGAKWIAEEYIGKGQNTIYKMKWNPDNPGTHQYATDMGWAVKQTSNIKKLYDQFPTAKLSFEVPQYQGLTVNIEVEKVPVATSTVQISILKESLSINTKGVNEQVKSLQCRLNELGYTNNSGQKLKEDGCFGKNTLEAVNKYKVENKLDNKGKYEGVVGSTTWQHLFTSKDKVEIIDISKTPSQPISTEELIKPLQLNVKGVDGQVKLLQKRLNELGYKDSKGNLLIVDGIFGKRTLQAVNEYKKINKLDNKGVNEGIVGTTTWEYLLQDTKKLETIPKITEDAKKESLYIPTPGYTLSHTNGKFGTMYFKTGKKSGAHLLIARDPEWEAINLTKIELPPCLSGSPKIGKVKTLTVNKNVADKWEQVFQKFQENPELLDYVKHIDPGTSYARYITGSTTVPSNHCWGTAIDINASDYPQGKKIDSGDKNHPQVILWEKIFKPLGFSWGNDYQSKPDPMHFEILTF